MTIPDKFCEFPKIPRLARDIIITEKIDGTNAQIYITDDYKIIAGSRTRYLMLGDDNYGFAHWVDKNKVDLLGLGPGRHFGEWWGSGIGRGYGLIKGEKRFSLFNTTRWCLFGNEPKQISDYKYQEILPKCCGLVPELYKGMFDTTTIEIVLGDLSFHGSYASEGFMKPEGIVIYHPAGNYLFKKTIEKDDSPKNLN